MHVVPCVAKNIFRKFHAQLEAKINEGSELKTMCIRMNMVVELAHTHTEKNNWSIEINASFSISHLVCHHPPWWCGFLQKTANRKRPINNDSIRFLIMGEMKNNTVRIENANMRCDVEVLCVTVLHTVKTQKKIIYISIRYPCLLGRYLWIT